MAKRMPMVSSLLPNLQAAPIKHTDHLELLIGSRLLNSKRESGNVYSSKRMLAVCPIRTSLGMTETKITLTRFLTVTICALRRLMDRYCCNQVGVFNELGIEALES